MRCAGLGEPPAPCKDNKLTYLVFYLDIVTLFG